MTCPACGGSARSRGQVSDRLFRTTAQRFGLCSCQACGLWFLDPIPPPAELAGYYPRGYWVGAQGGAQGRLTERYRMAVLRDHVRFVAAIVAEQHARGMAVRILDVGCGDGSFFAALSRHPVFRAARPRCVGLDQSLDAARAVRARGFDALLGQLTALPLRDRTFSLVTMFHYLEHVHPAGPHLAAVQRLLVAGGELVVQVPNAESFQARVLGRRWGGFDPPRHLIHYGRRTLRESLRRHGFEVVRDTTFSLRDNPTTLVNSLLPGLYPPARAAAGRRSALADLLYLAAVLAAMPPTWLEAACGHGAAVMARARPINRT
jgi:SAM-dependent methyltransferase